jgi:hypothetical protein
MDTKRQERSSTAGGKREAKQIKQTDFTSFASVSV